VARGDQQVKAREFFELSLHASHGDVQCSSRDDVGRGELLLGAWVEGDIHVVREITEMFHGHGNYFARFRVVIDELDGLSFYLRVLYELFEPTPLNEDFDRSFR
jgi:hypothetical protein